MQLRNAVIVAVEEREEILGQVAAVFGGKGTDDAEVDGRVARVVRIVDQHEDVSRVHVGVEEVVPEDLREEDLDAVLGEPLDVRPGRAECFHVADRRAEDAFLHHDLGQAVVEVHVGNVEEIRTREVALELRRVRRLAHQVELVENRLLVLADDFQRPQPVGQRPVAVRELGKPPQDLEIALDLLLDTGSQKLDDDLGAVVEGRGMHLCDRRRRVRLDVEACEDLGDGPLVSRFEYRDGLLARKRRDEVLQLREFVCDVARQQVAARRQRLAELDEDRAELLEREPYAHPERRRAVDLARRQQEQEAEWPEEMDRVDDVVEAVADQDALNTENAPDRFSPADHRCRASTRFSRASARSTSSRSSCTSSRKRFIS